MIVVGLTGSIATGKSSVASVFREAGAKVIDADRLARAAVKKGTPAWQTVVDTFGPGILLPNGEIDRPQLGAVIFNDPIQRDRLNAIVHPYVIAETAKMLKQIEIQDPQAVVVLDVPLLFEAGMDEGLDEIIVVYVPESVQRQRLMARDRLTLKEAMARIRTQIPIEEKKNRATIVIDNSTEPSVTRAQTLAVYQELKKRA
ncbi:MAG: dephospho-CoA kinase [Desulfobacteraceae bacterium]|nr:dephospho-CoA kinase [Desulfobacteraceae bacterium]